MSGRSYSEVGDVGVRTGLDLVEQAVAWSDPEIDANGILTVTAPNVLIDLEDSGIKTLNGFRFLDGNGDPMSDTVGAEPPIVGPVTIAARTSGGDPALSGLTFTNITINASVKNTERFEGTHGASVTIDAYGRPVQLFYRTYANGGAGAWVVPDWAA